MMMITAMILATGPSIDWRICWSGCSHGMEEPEAWAAGAIATLMTTADAVIIRRRGNVRTCEIMRILLRWASR